MTIADWWLGFGLREFWLQPAEQPGVLIWSGTPFSIRYEPAHRRGGTDFGVYRDGVLIERACTLEYAKLIVRMKLNEMREMGVEV